jgi:hypothetical protein
MVIGRRTKGNTVKATLAMGPIELSLAPSAPIRILKKKIIVQVRTNIYGTMKENTQN